MASQTGTLKFRQSDGTYTELYPKTTIAQVDGLQTQLDSINTSLQNKVDYNNAEKTDIEVSQLFFTPIESKANTQSAQIHYAYNMLDLATFHIGKNGYRMLSLFDSEGTTDPNNSVRIIERGENGNDIEYVLATQNYVTERITGAINTSY